MSHNVPHIHQIVQDAFRLQKQNLSAHERILVEYTGTLNPEIIADIETRIESLLKTEPLTKTQSKKLFFICIETLQNMFIHGATDKEGIKHNYFILTASDEQFQMQVGNLTETHSVEKTKARIDEVNAFESPEALKAFYLDHLDNNQISEKGGAGLGFITIGMKSGQPIKYRFSYLNEEVSFFEMEIKISRNG